jgi:hypothetical protein
MYYHRSVVKRTIFDKKSTEQLSTDNGIENNSILNEIIKTNRALNDDKRPRATL